VPTQIALVACVKTKRESATHARDLYLSQLFRATRRYAEKYADDWYILSAKYGLLSPGDVVEPYERTLKRMPKPDRLKWADCVQTKLIDILPGNAKVIILAGKLYREGIEPFLRDRGFSVSVPMEGLKFGEQLKFLNRMAK
jgi:cytoplasmic iron level regulating protein YaaA (DUF328/UPF0246 family)